MKYEIVADEMCPNCRRVGRPKVCDADGTWWWKCPSSRDECAVGYYEPFSGETEAKLDPDEERALAADIMEWAKTVEFTVIDRTSD